VVFEPADVLRIKDDTPAGCDHAPLRSGNVFNHGLSLSLNDVSPYLSKISAMVMESISSMRPSVSIKK